MTLKDELAALDRKNLKFYDNLSDEDKKKFSGYVMLRYVSSVKGDTDLEAYYLIAANKRVNIHFWELNKHPELQWLVCTTASPGVGIQIHQWISTKKKEKSTNNKVAKFLQHINLNLKDDEIELLSTINSEQECKEQAKELGWDDKTIKAFFK